MTPSEIEHLRKLLEEAERNGSLADFGREIRRFFDDRNQSGLLNGAAVTTTSDKASSAGKFGIVGQSPAMKAVFDRLEKMIPSSFPVLIFGESGTGKELIARALHEYGPRKDKPFFSTNCAAIPETLLEAELFGHKKGSFTGAIADRKGHFVAAHGGTLFLDEIGDMPLTMQSKLLRVLEDHEVRPVGGNTSVKVDVRIVAASNKKLTEQVAQGKFRQDLFFRLNVLSVDLPPLRDRKEDIPLLVAYFCKKVGAEMKRPIEFTPDALEKIVKHAWPGNVRELENEVRRDAALSSGKIDVKDLRPELQ